MSHKYLEELESYTGNFWGLKNDKREPEWVEERKTYGFDSTETWSLDTSFYLWLYEHLRMYVEKAGEIVNLHYHKFTYNDKEYYQDELIDLMIERLQFAFSSEYDEYEEDQWAYVHEIEKIWALILPAMWW